jgi:hypothetical protein
MYHEAYGIRAEQTLADPLVFSIGRTLENFTEAWRFNAEKVASGLPRVLPNHAATPY